MKDEKKVEQNNEETVELFGGKENLDKIEPWDFISAIKDAQDQAIKEGIRANTILINSRLVKTKPFMIMLTPFLGAEVPPMICGLETKLADDLPQEFAFAIMQAPQTERERQQKETVRQVLHMIKDKGLFEFNGYLLRDSDFNAIATLYGLNEVDL